MPTWVRRTAGLAPRNGTLTHTVTFTAATSGNLLVAVIAAGVTHAFSAGWTERQQPVAGTELSVATKTAAAGETTVTITHNAANYPMQWVIYEFAAGSTFGVSLNQAGVAAAAAWSTLGAIPSGSTVFAAHDFGIGAAAETNVTTAWTTPATEDVDAFTPVAGGTDGAYLSVAYVDSYTGGSLTPSAVATFTGVAAGDSERVAFSVQPVVASPPTVLAGALTETDVLAGAPRSATALNAALTEGDSLVGTLRSATALTAVVVETDALK